MRVLGLYTCFIVPSSLHKHNWTGAEGKQGRRAKRNQKRAAADLDDPNECY